MRRNAQGNRRVIWYALFAFLVVSLFAGCTALPAQTPPQLQHTPGPFIVVAKDTVRTPAYQVDVPPDWKIVKNSIASDPMSLVFAASDDEMMIVISDAYVPPFTTDAAYREWEATLTLDNGHQVYLVGRSLHEHAETFEQNFDAVRRSLRTPDERAYKPKMQFSCMMKTMQTCSSSPTVL